MRLRQTLLVRPCPMTLLKTLKAKPLPHRLKVVLSVMRAVNAASVLVASVAALAAIGALVKTEVHVKIVGQGQSAHLVKTMSLSVKQWSHMRPRPHQSVSYTHL